MTIIQKPAHSNNFQSSPTTKVGFVLHWVVGELAAADQVFTTATRRASAHYGVGSNGEVHQYVEDRYIAYHAGDLEANKKYIGIEHAGGQLINGARKKPTQACHDASVDLITSLCRKMSITELKRGKNIFKHSEIINGKTECCGTLNIDYITQKVNENLKKPNKPNNMSQVWKSKYIAENEDQFTYINELNKDYANKVATGDLSGLANYLSDRDQEIKKFKTQVKILTDTVSAQSVGNVLTAAEKEQLIKLLTKLIN